MVESIILFFAGFFAAALLALLATPALARRAMRLATARARLLSPLSETQARAERDALRGQFAVEQVKLEKRLQDAEDSRAVARVEVGRQATHILAMEETLAGRVDESARLRAEIAGLEAEGRDLAAQIGTRELVLLDLTAQRDRTSAALATAQARNRTLETRTDETRTIVASLETRIAALETELDDALRSAASERTRLSAALAERAEAASRLRSELEAALSHGQALAAEAERQTSEAASLRGRLAELESGVADSFAGAKTRPLELSDKLDRQRDEPASREIGPTDPVAPFATATAAPADRGGLPSEFESLKARFGPRGHKAQGGAKNDAALRKAIAKLGRATARAYGHAGPDEAPAPEVFAFARREVPAPFVHAGETSPNGATRLEPAAASDL